jgi:hypothetical protein
MHNDIDTSETRSARPRATKKLAASSNAPMAQGQRETRGLPVLVVSERKAALMIGMSATTLARHREAGTGPVYVQLAPRRIGYRVRDLESWLETRLSR